MSAMAVCVMGTKMAAVELAKVALEGSGMEKPEAVNCQKPEVALMGMKESGPVNSVGSMKPKL